MSRRHDEAPWEARVDRFVRSPKKVVLLTNRPVEKPEPETETEPKEASEP